MIKIDYHGQGRIISSRKEKQKLVTSNTAFLRGFNYHLSLDVLAYHISSLKPDLTFHNLFHDLSVIPWDGLSTPVLQVHKEKKKKSLTLTTISNFVSILSS